MQSGKIINLNIYKDYDYEPVRKNEKERLAKILLAELVELAERFDGPVKVEVIYNASGNI